MKRRKTEGEREEVYSEQEQSQREKCKMTRREEREGERETV